MNSLSSEAVLNVRPPTILVLGVGNPILSDDGVGIHVVKLLQKKFSHISSIEFAELSTGGLSLAERFVGYKYVIMIDALALENGIPGDVYRLTINDFETTIHAYCAHDCNLATAYNLLKQELGEDKLPLDVVIIGIEVEKINEFNESLSKTVEKAVPVAVALCETEISKLLCLENY